MKYYQSLLSTIIFCMFCIANAVANNSYTQGESITFILGEDKKAKNPYYKNAENYFKYNKTDKTEYVVNTCKSMVEVKNYLIDNVGDFAWKKINLVSHGNQYFGLSAKVKPKGKRSTSKSLKNYFESEQTTNFTKCEVDENTIVEIFACGVGKNEKLVSGIQHFFSNENCAANVVASKYFTYFIVDEYNPKKVKKHFAKYYYLNYKKGYKPNNNILSRNFSKAFPNNLVNWHNALQNEIASNKNETFNYTYDVPVKWVIKFEEEETIPTLKTKAEKLTWIKQNNKITMELAEINLKPEDVNWWFRNVYVTNEDGTKSKALWIKGYSTIHCILELL